MARPAKSSSRRTKRKAPRPRGGWWGSGPSPAEQWPGATIHIEARWSARNKRWETTDGLYYFDQGAADRVVTFFAEYLQHLKGEFDGQPFELLDYQRLTVVAPLFGWKRKADGLRRFRKVFLFIAKGNGKSPLCAGIGLCLLVADGEAGSEVYAAAADREQARIVFDTARLMVERDEDLSRVARPFKNVIEGLSLETGKPNGSYLKVLSADVKTKHGFIPHGIVIDELHAQPNRDLYETLDRGTAKRRQPVTMLASTAGDDEESICFEEYQYAKGVIAGNIHDDTYLPIVFELGPEDDWTDERNWPKANPGMGITIKTDALRAECAAAQVEPRKRNAFLQLHGNIWVSDLAAWLSVDDWNALPRIDPELEKLLATLQVAAGLDMSQKWDLTSFTLTFRVPLVGKALAATVVVEDEAGQLMVQERALNYRVASMHWFWIPEETLREHVQKDRIPYDRYREDGFLRVTPGRVIDHEAIVRDIRGIGARFPLVKQGRLGYDPAFATELAMSLQRAGFNVAEVPQNYKHLSEPAQTFEALVKSGRWLHDGNAVMRSHVENVVVRQDDAGRIRPVKPKKARSTKRIDGVVSSLMGLSGVMAEPESKRSMYSDRAPVLLPGETEWVDEDLVDEPRRFFDTEVETPDAGAEDIT